MLGSDSTETSEKAKFVLLSRIVQDIQPSSHKKQFSYTSETLRALYKYSIWLHLLA